MLIERDLLVPLPAGAYDARVGPARLPPMVAGQPARILRQLPARGTGAVREVLRYLAQELYYNHPWRRHAYRERHTYRERHAEGWTSGLDPEGGRIQVDTEALLKLVGSQKRTSKRPRDLAALTACLPRMPIFLRTYEDLEAAGRAVILSEPLPDHPATVMLGRLVAYPTRQ